jgi:hypothetical protein
MSIDNVLDMDVARRKTCVLTQEGCSVKSKLLTEAWGQFLSQFPWDWFVTLTFAEPVPSFRAYRLFGQFVRDIEKAAGMRIAWFMAFEYGRRGGRLHLHALMLNVAHLSRLWWMDEWSRRAGYARILPFDRSRGAAYYCGKYVTKGSGEWELVGLPGIIQPALPLVPGSRYRMKTVEDRLRIATDQSAPDINVRRHRLDRLYWHRRDWESEMLRRAQQWGPLHGGGATHGV